MPTKNAFQELCVAKAAAKTGASVETDPSISPTSPGWITCSTKRLLASASSLPFTSPGNRLAWMSAAVRSCRNSASARSPSRPRTAASVVRLAVRR